ncbi:MAG: hypothetical protein J0H11_01800 [Rhizobiales bacterium]|nr:hypothetical protein [Hyphomicrobiales bacterium]
MPDDYSAPLGLDRDRRAMRWRIWPIALALSLGLVGFVAGWAIVFHDPDGGQPVLRQRLPTVPAVLPTPPQPAEPADDPSGQVIIRDP